MKLKYLLENKKISEDEIFNMSDDEIMAIAKKDGRNYFNKIKKVIVNGLKKDNYSHPIFKYINYSSVNGIDPDHNINDALESVLDLVTEKYKNENKTKFSKMSRMTRSMIIDVLLASKFKL